MLAFGRLSYGEQNAISNAIGYAEHFIRSHDAVIRVYDAAGNVIETHEHKGDFKEWSSVTRVLAHRDEAIQNGYPEQCDETDTRAHDPNSTCISRLLRLFRYLTRPGSPLYPIIQHRQEKQGQEC